MALFPASNPFRHWRKSEARASCAGLDIRTDRVRLALLRRRRHHLELELLAEHVFDSAVCEGGQIGDFELLAQGCRELLRSRQVDAGGLAIAVSSEAAPIPLVLPAASDDVQRLAQVRSALAAYGFSADDYAFDYIVAGAAPASPADVQVLALAIPALMVEDRLALAEALQTPLRAMPPENWCTAGFLRGNREDAVLRVDASGAWLSLQPCECRPLRRMPSASPIDLLHELAPLLRRPPRRLLLTGDGDDLDTVAAAIRKYAGITTAIAALPARIRLAGTLARNVLPLELPPFHCALALAAEGLA